METRVIQTILSNVAAPAFIAIWFSAWAMSTKKLGLTSTWGASIVFVYTLTGVVTYAKLRGDQLPMGLFPFTIITSLVFLVIPWLNASAKGVPSMKAFVIVAFFGFMNGFACLMFQSGIANPDNNVAVFAGTMLACMMVYGAIGGKFVFGDPLYWNHYIGLMAGVATAVMMNLPTATKIPTPTP